MDNTSNRRRFLQFAAIAAAAPLAVRFGSAPAHASTLPRIPVDHPKARALAYVKVASEAASHPAFKAGSNCANCRLFVAATEGCVPLPGFSVEPKGWCAVWVKKA